MNIEQERLYGFGSYLSIRCTTIAFSFIYFILRLRCPFIQSKENGGKDFTTFYCRVIWRRNWWCLGLSWKMHGFCSVAKKQAHVPPCFLLKF
jgi:hypothetical protein